MSDKPNCHECCHRGTVPGSAHSSCHHPVAAEAHENQLAKLASMLGGGGPPPMKAAEKLNIQASPHGIARGWFSWPFSFDPVWLQACDGFELKEPKTS